MKTNSLFLEVQYFTKSLCNCSGDEYVLYTDDTSLRECAFPRCGQILHNVLESVWERVNCVDFLLFQASKNSQQSVKYKSLQVCHFSVTCDNFIGLFQSFFVSSDMSQRQAHLQAQSLHVPMDIMEELVSFERD